jgi:response regulator RpfG family c-di-GMP phosphodiesterase
MSKPVIVAVDDTEFVLMSIKSGLEGKYDVHTFPNGIEAMDYISNNPVDLVLLDYDMPEMTGYEVLMKIRHLRGKSDIPAIFLTGVIHERMEQEMRTRGAQDYIRKPIDFAVLRQHIETLLKK